MYSDVESLEETLKYYVLDGCKKNANDFSPNFDPGYFANEEITAQVRCCNIDSSSCPSQSRSCANEDPLSYLQAKAYCEGEGLRLCTKEEIEGKKCCGKGGQCDQYAIWTSTSGGNMFFCYFEQK